MSDPKSMLDVKEGWQANALFPQRVYHYIRDTMALCRRLGFYQGALVPQPGDTPKGDTDCAQCYRLLMKERKK